MTDRPGAGHLMGDMNARLALFPILLAACGSAADPAVQPCSPDRTCPGSRVCDLPSNTCVEESETECTSPPCREPVAELGVPHRDKLDILAVIDTSAPASQLEVRESFSLLFERLFEQADEHIDLHIGSITTDVGAGPYDLRNCMAPGDDGMLQDQPQGTCEAVPEDPYIAFVIDGQSMTDNVPDPHSLTDTFLCIAPRGVDGCGFEQPFESMRRALDGRNPGFRRPDAPLLVVVYNDEDDCSAADTSLFDPDPDAGVGPLSSFRCFEHGVVCSDDGDPRASGPRQGCVSREQGYLTPLADFVATLRTLAPDPEAVAVAVISGPAEVNVSVDPDGASRLDGPCISTGIDFGEVGPSIRQIELTDRFGLRGMWRTLCAEPDQAMLDIGGLALRMLGTECVTDAIADLDPDAAGVQGDCVAERIEADGARTPVPACGDGGPCFRVEPEAGCPHAQGLRFVVEGADPEARYLLRCLR